MRERRLGRANEASATTLAGVGRLCPSVKIWVTGMSAYWYLKFGPLIYSVPTVSEPHSQTGSAKGNYQI
jgi:hypothetical protein